MTEEQADRMIELLETISSSLSTIESNTSPVYDASDVCSRLDDIHATIQDM